MIEFISFSVDDIRKLRTRESKKLLKMTMEERIEYFRKNADEVRREIEELRKKDKERVTQQSAN